MATAKELKTRISSVKDTQKITNAMYLISSTKLQKAKRDLDRTRPYFDALKGEIKRIFRIHESILNPYFYPPSGEPELRGTYGYLVITADKGLAGAYNQNVVKEAQRLMSKRSAKKLFVVGEYGRQYFLSHHIPIEQSFLYTAQNPTLDRARDIADILLEQFDRGELVKIFIIYTDFGNGLEEQVCASRLLPFHRADFITTKQERAISSPFEFVPSMERVLDNIVPNYLAGYIYSALIDSFCSEQNARMMAMDAANRNAQNLLEELSMEYNRVRQNAITREITEVSAGAKALRDKREKEAK